MTLDLPAIRARAEAATPGPWVSDGSVWGDISCRTGTLFHDIEDPADAEFVAMARTDIPALLAEVERLTRNLEYASAECCDLSAYRQLVREEHPAELERVARWVATELRPDLSPAEIDALVAEALEATRG